MYLLDTNVLSELMRPNGSDAVFDWVNQRPASQLYTSAIVRAEIELGIAKLPLGKRRSALLDKTLPLFNHIFAGRCLAFDEACAKPYANLRADCDALGRPISTEDAQIAATALASGFKLVTRNTKDFKEIENLKLVDPWTVQNQ